MRHRRLALTVPPRAAALGLAGPAQGRGQGGQQVEITARPASEADQRRRDPVARSIVGRDELDQYGDIAVTDVLKRQPGVSMQGGNPRLRGLGGSCTLLPINGEAAPPGFSLDQLSPSQVERIEITRGPSAKHSAQAVAGTINIIVREAPRIRQRELGLRTSHQAVRPVLSGNVSWGDRSGALSYTLPLSVYQRRGQAGTASERRSTVQNGVDLLPGVEGLPFDARITRSALFAQDEWALSPRWSTSIGLRAEQIDARAGGLGGPVQSSSRVVTPVWRVTRKLGDKGRDLLRASLTRSYKAPELNPLSSRPITNTLCPTAGGNVEASPDSVGNLALRPELATGLDIAFEHYLPAGGVVSLGGFHRRISGLIRQQTSLQAVAWSSVPRWVSMPVNLRAARSTGIELELKGRGDALWPTAVAAQPWLKRLSLCASASAYRSSIDGIPGPDNRLVQPQPLGAATGFDQLLGLVLGAPPLTVGANLVWTPGCRTQQTPGLAATVATLRALDVHALWTINRQTMLRLGGNNLLADGTRSTTVLQPESGGLQTTLSQRASRRSVTLGLSVKF